GGQLDLGAVGKGIACDVIGDWLESGSKNASEKAEEETEDVTAAQTSEEKAADVEAGTFSVGGSVLVYGAKPDGTDWKIGIQDPRGEEGTNMAAVSISQEAGQRCYLSTSGDYEKYIEKDGKRYHHIMDPSTGAPADSGLISVTILSDSGFLSDALSTACFVAGLEKGIELADSYGVKAIFIDENKQVYVTEETKEILTILKKEYVLKNEAE
ncbi:MAG: FAD:protein FMN transferase, partial [Lachnospiraceae bacterium]|nr:FAD:protein FMN transferase [Lachnospiraceae bacterium]